MRSRWRVKDRLCVDQVANAPDSNADLTPASEAPALAVKEAWSAWLPGQEVPLIWEAGDADESCCDL